MTIGDMMAERSLCKDQSWSSVSLDSNDAARVEFRCTLSGTSDYFSHAVNGALAAHDEFQAKYGPQESSSAQQELQDTREMLAIWKAAAEDPEKHPDVVALREWMAELEVALEDPSAPQNDIKSRIEAANNILESELEKASAEARREIPRYERFVSRLERKAAEEAERNQERLRTAAERRNEIIDNYQVDGAEEHITWVIENGRVHVEDGGILLAKASGDELNWRYSDLGNVLEVIHDVEVAGPELDNFTPAIEARRNNRGFRSKHL